MHVATEFTVDARAADVWRELSTTYALALAICGAEVTRLDGESGFTGPLRGELSVPTLDCVATVRPIDTDEDACISTCQLHVRQVDASGVALGMVRCQIVGGQPGAVVSLSFDGRVAGAGLNHGSVETQAESVIASLAAVLGRVLTERTARTGFATAPPSDRVATDGAQTTPAPRTTRRARAVSGVLVAAAALAFYGLWRRRFPRPRPSSR
jgi:carbon monoxide dehydrogenase subunit G